MGHRVRATGYGQTLLFLILFACIGFAQGQSTPTRIVSLNPCLDGLLVELAPREHIVALSHYSRDPWRTVIAETARDIPITYETAEEIVALHPDLVLAGRHSDIATRNALKRVGIPFELFDVPMSVDESHAQIRRLAQLLGETARGDALIARIDEAIAAARAKPNTPVLTAVVYQPAGLTAGSGTITDELMRVVGLDNLPARHDVHKHRPIPMETLLRDPPDLLLVGDTTQGAATHAERIVHHRALRALDHRMHREVFPARLLYCAGPTMIHSVRTLAQARDRALEERTRDGSQ